MLPFRQHYVSLHNTMSYLSDYIISVTIEPSDDTFQILQLHFLTLCWNLTVYGSAFFTGYVQIRVGSFTTVSACVTSGGSRIPHTGSRPRKGEGANSLHGHFSENLCVKTKELGHLEDCAFSLRSAIGNSST